MHRFRKASTALPVGSAAGWAAASSESAPSGPLPGASTLIAFAATAGGHL